MASKLNIIRGKTFEDFVFFGKEPLVLKAITGISLLQGSPRLSVVGHGLPSVWPIAITRVEGMRQINCASQSPSIERKGDYVEGTVIDPDTVELRGVTPVSDTGKEWPAYTGGGFIQYYTPASLSGAKARFVLKKSISRTRLLKCVTGGTSGATIPTAAGQDGGVTWAGTAESATKMWRPGVVFVSGDVVDAEAYYMSVEGAGVTLDDTLKRVARKISAADTAIFPLNNSEFECEIELSNGDVLRLDAGVVSVSDEVAK